MSSTIKITRAPDIVYDILYSILNSLDKNAARKQVLNLNNLVKLIRSNDDDVFLGFSLEEIVRCGRKALLSSVKEVRAATIRALRYLFKDRDAFIVFYKLHIDLFLIRALDSPYPNEIERVQVLRFLRKIIRICPDLFPRSLVSCLVAIGDDEYSQTRDRFSYACLATLCELAVSNAEIVALVGGINTIIRNILDCQMHRINEAMMMTILYLFDHPMTRKYMRPQLDLEAIVAPFTDLQYRYSADIPDFELKDDHQFRLTTSKLAITTIFKTWEGIICMCKADGSGFRSLLGAFCLPNSEIRKATMDILYDVFRLRVPEWTNNFSDALRNATCTYIQDGWKLSEGWVAEEALQLLPPKTTRMNLVDNYLAVVLSAFSMSGLFESLVDVVTSEDEFIAVRATILLGELLHMANTIIPVACGSNSHSLPQLIALTTSLDSSPSQRSRAYAAIRCLDTLHQLKKRKVTCFNEYLALLLRQCNYEHYQQQYTLGKDAIGISSNSKDIDDAINQVVKDSKILSSKIITLWDWETIRGLLQSTKVSYKNLEDTSNTKFLRRLMSFYLPSKQQFAEIGLTSEQAQLYTQVGCLLVKFLLSSNEADALKLLQELIQEIVNALNEVISPAGQGTYNTFLSERLTETLSQYYFLLIGEVSSSATGIQILEKTGAFDSFISLCSSKSHPEHVKLLLSGLDYNIPGPSRVVLSKALTANDEHIRMYGTKYLRALLRAGVSNFSKWGLELLVTQLYDTNEEIAACALEITTEACEDKTCLESIVKLQPALLCLGHSGYCLMLRFCSIESGFTYLQNMGFLTKAIEEWIQHSNLEYVKLVERSLAEALTTFEKDSEIGIYVRRQTKPKDPLKAFVPVHVFGELAQLKNGCKLIIDGDYAQMYSRTVWSRRFNSSLEILQTKAALWALGHIGSSVLGLAILMKIGIIPDIVRLAEECEVFSIRGTSFYVLGLIAKTRSGANFLSSLGWESVRHGGNVQWPVLDEYDYVVSDPVSVSTDLLRGRSITASDNVKETLKMRGIGISTLPSLVIRTFGTRGESFDDDDVSVTSDITDYVVDGDTAADRQESRSNSVEEGMQSDKDATGGNLELPEGPIRPRKSTISGLQRRSRHSAAMLTPTLNQSQSATNLFDTENKQDVIRRSMRIENTKRTVSIKDAQGYKALTDLRRRSMLAGSTTDSHHLSSSGSLGVLSTKFGLNDAQETGKKSSRRPAELTADDSSKISSGTVDFIGLSLPVELIRVFQYKDHGYHGSWAKSFNPAAYDTVFGDRKQRASSMPRRSGSVTSSKGNINDGFPEVHDPNVCFGCTGVKFANLKKRHYSESDVFEQPGRKMTNQSDSSQDDAGANYSNDLHLSVTSSASVTSGSDQEQKKDSFNISSSSDSFSDDAVTNKLGLKRLDDSTTTGRSQIRKEILRLVTSLSGAVASKANQQGLMILKENFESAFKDNCLYSQVINLMTLYHYRLSTRKFIQGLFIDLELKLIIEDKINLTVTQC
ncbi:uncharacterized protein TRIADDRAFT_58016 [Trichoplax adhaerens]|uniref:Rapamycin-insensitive companion of mTOR domain-containing protein n=1 Tax=Trichoplax adhaerens TaxID=10228 RepID=B3S2G4_TRIAD|nr:hypothetical protein TRIADDRAFT_58016 [Trichoplax adhaerens]EDV23413.1 hypothetical protein TRIADDRAFT_58016 [Trichoplax adhaerens]|eukprot:XP_002114323.1 hypothetical protein TRIADDRAFT_58016 [Trichoplax adhaerens]